jgi:divalent metal cation (Fe/Co/Zn/Cd) transporter
VHRLAIVLLALTVAYNAVEGVLSIVAGLEADSIVLLSFGADSYLEVAAAVAVLWRLTYRDAEAGEQAEERAMRIVGATFLVLAAAVVFQSTYSLSQRQSAEASTLGLLVLGSSMLLMPALAGAKLWTAARTNMPALAAEAKETIACSYLTFTALAGLLAIALLGWWWLDALAALCMVPWLVREGIEGVRADACFSNVGRPCFCRSCLFGLNRCIPTCCIPACC